MLPLVSISFPSAYALRMNCVYKSSAIYIFSIKMLIDFSPQTVCIIKLFLVCIYFFNWWHILMELHSRRLRCRSYYKCHKWHSNLAKHWSDCFKKSMLSFGIVPLDFVLATWPAFWFWFGGGFVCFFLAAKAKCRIQKGSWLIFQLNVVFTSE